VILAGVANSIFVRLSLFKCLAKPIDGGKNFIDNKRIFGDSKTYKGFLGYIVLTAIFTVIWGLVCASIPNLQLDNFFYQLHANTLLFNVLIGSLLGLAWALFELPNSFIKRRLSIKPSANAKGIKGLMFMILDQADSIFGVMLVLAMFYPISVGQYFLFVAIGAATHILSNFLLFVVRIRKRPI
jgi:CDP-diglyceride synthetase